MEASSVRPKGIRLRTSFASEGEFVAAFHALCDESSIFVPTDKLHPATTSCYFSLELADEAAMLRGLGVVIDSWSIAQNPFGQPGIHVRITQLTTQSEPIFERLLAARPAALHRSGPRTRNAPMTQQQWGSVIAPPTTEMDAAVPFADEPRPDAWADPEETVPARPITREMGSASVPPATKATAAATAVSGPTAGTPAASVATRASPERLSAAPVAELDEKTTETARYEDHLRLPASGPTPASASAAARANHAPPSAPAESASLGAAQGRASAAVSPLSGSGFETRSPTLASPPRPNTPVAGAPVSTPPSPARAGTPPPIPIAGTRSPTSPHALGEIADYPVRSSAPWRFDDGSLEASPSSWWQAAWWRDGSWRTSWWATWWRDAPWRKAAWWRDGSWRTSWWATWWRDAPWRKAAWWRDDSWRNAWWATRRTGGVFAVGILVGVLVTVVLRPSRSAPAPAPALAATVPAPQPLASCAPAPVASNVVASTSRAEQRPSSTQHGKTTAKVATATAPASKAPHAVATRPATTKVATPPPKVASAAPTKSTKSTAKSVAPTTRSTAAAIAKSPPATSTKSVATTAPKRATTAAAKPSAGKRAGTNVAAAKSSAASAKRGKRAPCASLDCI